MTPLSCEKHDEIATVCSAAAGVRHLAQLLLDHGVVGDGDALLVNVSKATLVHQLADGLDVGGAVGDVCVDGAQHVKGGLVETQEDAVVDLAQAQQLQNLAGLGVDTVDTVGGALDRAAHHGHAQQKPRVAKLKEGGAEMKE